MNMMHRPVDQYNESVVHVLNDPVGLIYTPDIFSSICMYFTQYWLPPRVRFSCCSNSIHVMMIYKLFSNYKYLTATVIS